MIDPGASHSHATLCTDQLAVHVGCAGSYLHDRRAIVIAAHNLTLGEAFEVVRDVGEWANPQAADLIAAGYALELARGLPGGHRRVMLWSAKRLIDFKTEPLPDLGPWTARFMLSTQGLAEITVINALVDSHASLQAADTRRRQLASEVRHPAGGAR